VIDPEKEGTTCFHRELGKNLFNDSHIPDDANLHQHRYDNLKCLWVKCRAATVWNRNEWSPVFRRKMNKNGGWGGVEYFENFFQLQITGYIFYLQRRDLRDLHVVLRWHNLIT